MTTFRLSSGPNIFDLDTAGGVSQGGNAVGSWTTNRANQIVVTKAGAAVAFDVAWVFNNKNQLTIRSQNTEVFNFATAPGLRNLFETRDTVLRVKPNRLNAFVFELHGDWDLDQNHDLSITIGASRSVLDGFVSDPLGRFVYHFANRDNVLQTNALGFAGAWQSRTDANGAPQLEFHYQKEPKPDGSPGGEAVFKLPKPLAVKRSSNQLTYTYKKDNKTLSIDFQGTLMISPDFQIAYVVQRQVSSAGEQMVASTTLGFEAMLAKPNLHGELELAIKKPDGSAGGTTLTIGGQFQGVLGASKLQVGFAFSQTFGANSRITRTVAFNGSLEFSQGKLQWAITATGSTVELAVGADIRLGDVQADARLNITLSGGEVAGITFLLGVNF